jgi:nucleotide-binding universal stress UspA family protein
MALGLARRERATLLLLHVLTPPSPFTPPGGEMPSSYLALLDAARREARRRLAALLERARAAGALARARLVAGGPADEILKTGRGWRPDLIVIGTHGRGGVRRFLMGSVAEHVVRRAARPVLTVRGR